jgi:hypothetical protein
MSDISNPLKQCKKIAVAHNQSKTTAVQTRNHWLPSLPNGFIIQYAMCAMYVMHENYQKCENDSLEGCTPKMDMFSCSMITTKS